MALFPHYINIYPRPKEEATAVAAGIKIAPFRRKLAYNYQHKIVSNGWFDTMSCNLATTRIEAENIFENWLGNRVSTIVDNPLEPCWEGLITRITLGYGDLTFSRSLDDMMNKAIVTYTNSGAVFALQTATTSDLASQAIYGIKQGSIEGKLNRGVAGTILVQMQTLRDTMLAFRAYPKTSVTSGQGSDVSLHIECQGFYYTLEWEEYTSAVAADQIASTVIGTALATLSNGTTFFNNVDLSKISANATFSKRTTSNDGLTYWQWLQNINEAGDGTSRWIMGISPTNPSTGKRALYYRAFNNVVGYTAYMRDGLRVRNVYGGLVRPWAVVPDTAIRVNDVLTGWNSVGDDPRTTYVDTISYDAEAQTVDWQGGDDPTIEGVFNLRNLYQNHNVRFGAPVRQVG